MPSAPVQQAAALAFAEPPPITCRIAASRALHAQVAAAVAAACTTARLVVPPPAGRFLRLPRLRALARLPADRHQVTTAADLAHLLLHRYGAATLPGSAFGEPPAALRLRLATALLYGDSEAQQEAALAAPDPTTLPWIAATLTRLIEILTDLACPVPGVTAPQTSHAELPDLAVPIRDSWPVDPFRVGSTLHASCARQRGRPLGAAGPEWSSGSLSGFLPSAWLPVWLPGTRGANIRPNL